MAWQYCGSRKNSLLEISHYGTEVALLFCRQNVFLECGGQLFLLETG
jgi:hypothetical protein